MYIHPELTDVLAALPPRPANPYADLPKLRAEFRALMAPRMTPDPRVTVEHVAVGALDAQLLRPAATASSGAAILYLHGGGFAYGELDGPSPMARDACAAAGAVVLNPHYRLAPEHRFPAGIEDCYAALCWLHAHARELGVDPERIAVCGASAGANLSAAVALMARDRGGPPIAFQSLLIPLLDDRMDTPSMRTNTDPRVINGPGIAHTWDTYLGPGHDPATTSPYAAPARADDLRGLPPAYVLTCGLDPLADEGVAYAQRLIAADVAVELHHVPGAWHLFEAYAPDSKLARATTAHWLDALRRMGTSERCSDLPA